MRILVTGGREFDDWNTFKSQLCNLINTDYDIIIHGDAKGADFCARLFAKSYGFEEVRFPADWKQYGKAAGSTRNQQMLDEGKPDIVIAFPGGVGTADMVRRAKKAGLEVVEVGK